MRCDFVIGEDDLECLTATKLDWDTIIDGGSKWLILRTYAIPYGYNVAVADTALRIPPAYPDDQIDMVYFFPALALLSGHTIGGLTPQLIEGKQYQQWSRHRTPANPWRPGLDNVYTHLLQVRSWLEREVRKVA